MDVNFELYKVFYVVGQEMNFSKAAQRLFISQSAVSQSIRQLEKKLGTPLFNRTTKQVSLTAAGEALMAHIEPAINMILRGEIHLQESKTLQRGQLHIAASDTICRYYLLDYFKKFHDTYPGVEIKVTNRTSLRGVELLHQGSVDLMVTNLPNHHLYKDMTATATKAFDDVFIASPERCDRKVYSLKELTEHPILMLTKQTATSEFCSDLFEEQGITLNPSIELGSIDLLVDMAKINLGIAFVPRFCVEASGDLLILDTEETIPKRHIGYVTHDKRPLSAAAQKFIELLC